MISALGRGVETLQAALETGPITPSMIDVPFQPAPFPVYCVSKETLKDRVALSRARRADRFSKMAVLAACDAVRDAGVELDSQRTGVVLGTAFGPHPTVFSFLDDILEFGDAGVSPTLFSHSVHNAAASYISVALGLAGPAMTLTTLTDPFQQSLLLAQTWIDQGVCDSVLVGGVEECGTVMEYIISQKLRIADEKMIPFFADSDPAVIPGEGAVFFLLSRDCGNVSLMLNTESEPDVRVVDFESTVLPKSKPAGCWSHLAGAMPVSSAVSCAVATLMLKNATVYPETSLVEIPDMKPEQVGCFGNGAPIHLKVK